ncbi:MAG: HNH endonuclease [Candidatus Dormibacteria bacterium]
MAWIDRDTAVRTAAFAWIAEQVRSHGSEVLPRGLLAEGFVFDGTRVPLLGPQGIFKPAALAELPLSILTVPRVEGRDVPYEDEITEDGLVYRYRGTDPNHPDNVGLRRAMERQVPLIYLLGLVPGQYLAVWPVYVVADDPVHHAFTVQPDDPGILQGDLLLDSSDDMRRTYALRTVRQRIHQHSFRQRVLLAYRMTCAVCRLRHAELLDAAHILPDGHPRGKPVVPNGLALCKIHHAAFDADIMGVRPDYSIEIRADVLVEIDGPMLLHGLQGVHNQRIVVPRAIQLRPSVAFLEERYGLFRKAG